ILQSQSQAQSLASTNIIRVRPDCRFQPGQGEPAYLKPGWVRSLARQFHEGHGQIATAMIIVPIEALAIKRNQRKPASCPLGRRRDGLIWTPWNAMVGKRYVSNVAGCRRHVACCAIVGGTGLPTNILRNAAAVLLVAGDAALAIIGLLFLSPGQLV